ncbi:DUF3095 family protein [Plasticicumulans lactativorans]|uniref:DUF3095 family protein n=1 Tax=Plasticicumulans lactativorans TaxID=1133106 RepID=A0A4R2KWW1_9GAMM|nr:DUF3095 domain-containing protein [Plasticicumulans lactativorans]TCO77532.1 DUF3095 family protein [Plasticicumulans lactativorans]
MSTDAARFFDAIPAFTDFADVAEPARYQPLPQDWLLALADVADSTGAVAAGRYKAVNLVGAGTIAAVVNALGGQRPPFVFGGDGAVIALPAAARAAVASALAATATWAREAIGLDLRVALIPVAAVRAAGHEVRVARFQVSPGLAYAMFGGGGIAWADARLKAGDYALAPAPAGAHPDLGGLSCRFAPLPAHRGEIVSLLALPRPGTPPQAFAGLLHAVLALLGEGDGGHPLPAEGPHFAWPPRGFALELAAGRGRRPLLLQAAAVLARSLFGWLLDRSGLTLGGFDAHRYRRELVANSDYRKFEDGLKLTLDLDPARSRALEALLERAWREGVCDYGLHRQDAALVTCFVPSALSPDHVHFVDGADGGYTRAAAQLKARRAAAR